MKIAGCIAVLLLVGPAAAVTPQPAAPERMARPLAAQSEPPTWPLDPIVVPAPGVPALVTWGGALEVMVRLAPGAGAGEAQDWLVALTTRTRGPLGRMIGLPVCLRYPLEVEKVEPAGAELVRLVARVPAWPPREVYSLEVAGPGGLRGTRVLAVRVLGGPEAAEKLRFVLVGDHQVMDPSTGFGGADLNNESYPHQGEDDAESMFIQQIEELEFLDPDFVLHVGDLVFGIDYRREVASTMGRWWQRSLATFMVPGNHDGHALYELALKDDWWFQALKSVRCARYVLDGEVTAVGVFKLLSCMLGDLKKILFEDLAQDGLDYWRRLVGPTDFSFDLGRFHFTGVNSYAGSAERRHAFVLSLGFVGIDLGAATVDNYGGTLTPGQLAWLQDDLQRADAAGKTVVLFLHHDPRGNNEMPWGRGYHENQPFPTEPLGLRKFQEWNYEGAWDSNPDDGREAESQTDNSAVALLRLIARHVSYVFTGHIHDDRDTVIEAGGELVPGSGIRATKRIRFVRVTTGSSTPDDDEGYWGYRRLHTAGDAIRGFVFQPQWGWHAVPSGNFWVVGSGVPASTLWGASKADDALFVAHNALPVPLEGRLRAYLPDVPEGYRFPATAGKVSVDDVGRGEQGVNVYYLEVRLPAVRGGVFPPPDDGDEQVEIRMERARGNRTPVVSFETVPAEVHPGTPVRFDGSASRDPEGRPLVQTIWDLGDGTTARGPRRIHTYTRPGRYDVSLTAVDDCGAFARYATVVDVTPPPSCSFGGAACAATTAGLVLFAGLVGLWWWRRKR